MFKTLFFIAGLILIPAFKAHPNRSLYIKLDGLSCTRCKEQLKDALSHFKIDKKHPIIALYPDCGKLQQKIAEQKIRNDVCTKTTVVFITENDLKTTTPFVSFHKSPEVVFKYGDSSILLAYDSIFGEDNLSEKFQNALASYFSK